MLGAPYLLMRVPARAVEFVRLPQPYLPEPAALDSLHVGWLVTDPSEWETHVARFGGTPAQFEDALSRCCDRVDDAGGVTVYHVRSTHR